MYEVTEKKREKMVLKSQNGVLIGSLILVFLLGMAGVSHAGLNMNEIRYLFEKEKGLSWEDATSEERKAFIRDISGREEYQEGQFKDQTKEVEEIPDDVDKPAVFDRREDIAPFRVRTSFEVETGREWDDATEEEKTVFWKEFKADEKKLKRDERLYSEKRKLKEQQQRRDYKLKKKELKLQKRQKVQEEKLRREKIRRKRISDKQEMKKKKREWEEFRRNLQEKHKLKK